MPWTIFQSCAHLSMYLWVSFNIICIHYNLKTSWTLPFKCSKALNAFGFEHSSNIRFDLSLFRGSYLKKENRFKMRSWFDSKNWKFMTVKKSHRVHQKKKLLYTHLWALTQRSHGAQDFTLCCHLKDEELSLQFILFFSRPLTIISCQ